MDLKICASFLAVTRRGGGINGLALLGKAFQKVKVLHQNEKLQPETRPDVGKIVGLITLPTKVSLIQPALPSIKGHRRLVNLKCPNFA